MNLRLPFILFLLLILTSSFQKNQPVTQSDLIEQYLDEKLEASRILFWEDCHQGIVDDAVRYVDSILYRVGQFSPQDTVQSPIKPPKPSRPFDTLKLDTTPIKPPKE